MIKPLNFNIFLKFYIVLFGTLTCLSLGFLTYYLFFDYNFTEIKKIFHSASIFLFALLFGLNFNKIQAYLIKINQKIDK